MKPRKSATPQSNDSAPEPQTDLAVTIERRIAEAGLIKKDLCDLIPPLVDGLLKARCGAKKNHLEPCDEREHEGCACTGSSHAGNAPKVDLFVLIDSSGSMSGSASAVSDAAGAAIEAVQKSCPTDLQVTYLGVDGTWPGTLFLTSHRAYLAGVPSPPPLLSTDNPVGGLDSEEGANAIEDLAKSAAWRDGACRAIFYISDEELDSLQPLGDAANEAAATSAAVAAANANKVTVFAHHLTYQNRGPAVIANYNDLCNLTGGKAFFSAAPDAKEYVKLLTDVICNACGSHCQEAKFPDLRPCVSISWGDSECDCAETDDVEVLCITVCNCYSNVTFTDLTVGYIIVTDDSGGPVPTLPDGTPSVRIVPIGPICFDDIPPCKDGKAGCVSREVVLWTRGAKGGRYRIHLGAICYGVTHHYGIGECFLLDLCQD